MYSYKGSYPQELPESWKFEDGSVVENLSSLTNSELESLGWYGPIDYPTGHFEYSYEWNSSTKSFDATELDIYEKQIRVDYQKFWDMLLSTQAYVKIKSEASLSLTENTIFTEFICLLGDAKNNQATPTYIQNSLDQITSNITFTAAEVAEIQNAFLKSGMFSIYTLNIG